MWGIITLGLMYSGDVFDTPPPVLRVVLGAVCLAGAVLVLLRLMLDWNVPAIVVLLGALLIAEFLIATIPTAAGITWATVAFGAVLAVFAISLPL
jgi:hypothetical protein